MQSKAFTEGYQAAYRLNSYNPYPQGSKEREQWNLGYEEARIDMAAGR